MLYLHAWAQVLFWETFKRMWASIAHRSQPLIISRKCWSTEKGRRKQRQGAGKSCLGGGAGGGSGSQPFQKKHWNEDVKFHLHSISFLLSSWWLHTLHEQSAGTRRQCRSKSSASNELQSFQIFEIFKWNIPLLGSQPKTVPSGVPAKGDGVYIIISLSPLFLAVGKAEFTAKAAKTNAQFIQVTCRGKDKNNCL